MSVEKLVDLDVVELREKEKRCRKELFNLRFQGAIGHVENPNRFSEVRKEIARILTVIKVRTVEAG